jgi:N-acetylglucosamine-6-phosphate deacetylase
MNETKRALLGGKVLLESGEMKNCGVLLEGGCIKELLPERQDVPDYEQIDCSGKIVAPGLIDTHVHGACGRNFMAGIPEAISEISEFLIRGGTTSCLGTTTSAKAEDIEKALRCLREASRNPLKGQVEILGSHLEGPFINPKNRGANVECNIRCASREELERITAAAENSLKIVTLAPEMDYASETIEFFAKKGVQVSIGHTLASYGQTQAALQAGASRGTHLFNTMPQIHHREPGAVVALLICPTAYLEIMVDGKHLAPAIIELILKTAGTERCILITDGVDARGRGDGTFQRWEGTTIIVQNGEARTKTGHLAGSMLSLSDAVRNMVNLVHVPINTAIRMASENPARSIGAFNRKGSISQGKDADFVIFNDDLSVHMTIVRGDIVYKGE